MIHAVLSTITSKSLKALHIESTSENILADLSNHDVCSRIDEVLATSQFSGLAKFELMFKFPKGDQDDFKAKIRASFPRADARGVLQLTRTKYG